MQRSDYLALRGKFTPASVKLVVVAESSPISGKYFYNPVGSVGEPLYAALMLHIPFAPTTKECGLLEFQKKGWVLVDATYEPVNRLSASTRDRVIIRDYEHLRDDLAALSPDRSVPVVLVKKNICPRLTEDGFKMLNGGYPVYFPSHGRQPDFHRQFAEILKSTN